MEFSTQILIIGGGPAGITASLAAQKFGLKSIILDRNSFPRDKICGDVILLNDINATFKKIDIDLSDLFDSKNFEDRYLFKNSVLESNHFINTLVLKRFEFDNQMWKLQKSESNNHLSLENSEIIEIKRNSLGFKVNIKQNNKSLEIFTNFIIGADGYSSFVRRKYFDNLKFNSRIASRYYLKTDCKNKLKNSFYFDDKISPGYFWHFKIDELTYNTGIYLPERSKLNILTIHQFFIHKVFNKEINESEIKTWPIPYNIDFNILVKDNVLLVGDAGGLNDKLFGHGIDNAIISGYLAVLSIHDFLNPNIPYKLDEIYPYNLNNYLGESMNKSIDLYNSLEKQKSFFSTLINYL